LAGRVCVGVADASSTPASGVVAVAELVGRLGATGALDDAVGAIKQRDRGLSAGEFLVAVAQAQMSPSLTPASAETGASTSSASVLSS
jgi:hypothetical protein